MFTPFIELYERGENYFEINLSDSEEEYKHAHNVYGSYTEVIDDFPSLKDMDVVLRNHINNNLYYSHSVDIYDQISFAFINLNNIIEDDTESSFWECYFIGRSLLMFELVEFAKHSSDLRRLSSQKAKIYFENFIKEVSKKPGTNLCIHEDFYSKLPVFDLEKLSLHQLSNEGIPEHYLRYYSSFWIFTRVAFYFNYPRIISLFLSFDARIESLNPNLSSATDVNIVSVSFNQNCLSISLRTSSKEEFLAVTTLKHYLDCLIREIAEFWRSHHRIYPPIFISLEYPLWNFRDISGSYFNVEVTSIIKLLMGKAFYGGADHVWFRELLQNAIDANATRQAFGTSDYKSTIFVEYDGQRTCIIRDNGIGMSYQHIVRYLTNLGKSIWLSEELEKKSSNQKPSQSIGKFGIGFVSVFQDAQRVYVKTKFFQDIGEEGWLIDFSSVEKPFFIEKLPTEIGTEIRIVLKEHLSTSQFASIVNQFFLYVSDSIEFKPSINLADSLISVQLVPNNYIEKAVTYNAVSTQSIGNIEFSLRTMFGYSFDGGSSKEKPPESYLLVTNAGVKVFQQEMLFLKPGKRFIWAEEENGKEKTQSPYQHTKSDNHNVLKHFFVVVDFKKSFSPILPSRIEIDIEKDFSEELLKLIYEQFCHGLEYVILEVESNTADLEKRRSKIIDCLMNSVHEPPWYRRKAEIFCDSEAVQKEIIKLFSKHCPICIKNLDNEETFVYLSDLSEKATEGIYVLNSLTKTSLFKVYVRALDIKEWVCADSAREYFLIKANLAQNWTGIFNDKDIYKVGISRLFKEKIESPLSQFVRGDYAVIDSDIFGQSALVALPSNLPGFQKPAEAARFTRAQVYKNYPARVLLNMNHQLFSSLQEYLSKPDLSEGELKLLRLLLNNFADGVIEQKRVGLARERWIALRQELTELTKQNFTAIDYTAVKG